MVMKHTRKIAMALAAVLLAGSLSGCGTKEKKDDKIKIGIAQSIEHTSLNQISDAIQKKLKALGYDGDDAEIVYRNAQGDASALGAIAQEFIGDEMDLVIPVGTTTAAAICGQIMEIPVVFSSITDPVGLGLVEAYDKTDKNVTGIANFFPLEDIFSLAFTLTPDIKSVGFIHCTSEYGAQTIIDNAKTVIDASYPGVSYEDAVITSSTELQAAVESLVGKVDAIFVPNDSVVASAMTTLSAIARENKVPVYATADSLVWDGGLATVGINYEELGNQTAEMADKILKGQSVADTDVQNIDTFRVVINETTANAIGVTIPDSVASDAELVKD